MRAGLIWAEDETDAADRSVTAWSARAACRGSAHLFFAPDRERPGRRARRERVARSLCLTCPVMLACRAWAREHREYGFWGGESEDERAGAGYPPALAGALRSRRQAS
jgi:WhiB family redox-sensing transcriptional regulator